jgi:hypothetical protein
MERFHRITIITTIIRSTITAIAGPAIAATLKLLELSLFTLVAVDEVDRSFEVDVDCDVDGSLDVHIEVDVGIEVDLDIDDVEESVG